MRPKERVLLFILNAPHVDDIQDQIEWFMTTTRSTDRVEDNLWNPGIQTLIAAGRE
jgi:hypothetical protein